MGAYSDAIPLSGKVPPITICDFVTPGVAWGAATSVIANAPGMLTASAATRAATAVVPFLTSPSFDLEPAVVVPPSFRRFCRELVAVVAQHAPILDRRGAPGL